MTDSLLWLDAAERQYLAHSLPADEVWPPGDALTPLLGQVPDGAVAGGPHLRAGLLAMMLRGGEDEMPLELRPGELWLLDSMMIRRDLRREKLPDGRPLLELAQKVWRLILDVYDDQLPEHLRREVHDAGSNEGADQDASAIIASAEALLRPRHGEGTGEDLSSAEA